MPAFQRTTLSQRINFRVTDEEYQLIRQRAESQGVEIVAVVRDALKQYFADNAGKSAEPKAKARKK